MRSVVGGIAVCLSLSACCGFAGDSSKTMELQLSYADQSGTFHPIADGTTLPFITGGQGFLMLAVNVAATNLNRCSCKTLGSINDATGASLVTASQSEAFTVDVGNGYWSMNGSNLFNVLDLLPCFTGAANFDGTPWQLEVSVTDGDGRVGSLLQPIISACTQPECSAQQRCHDICSGPDGGPWDAGNCQ